jgi:uncharacterized membrane protein YadS
MIVPITLILAIYTSKQSKGNNSFSFKKIFPWFVLGFIATSIISTTSVLPHKTCSLLAQAGKFLIVMAMVAIGLNTHFKDLVDNGIKPIFLGLSCWAAVALTSLIVQHVLIMW